MVARSDTSTSRTRKLAFESSEPSRVRPHVSLVAPRLSVATPRLVTAIDLAAVHVVPPSHESWAQSWLVPLLLFRPTSARTWMPPTALTVAGTPRLKPQKRWRSLPASVQTRLVFVPVLASVATEPSVTQAFVAIDS